MKKLILIIAVLLASLSFADEALDNELIANVCDTTKVKELIAKGANKNVMVKKDQSLYTVAIMSLNCGESAHYLSSIGATDLGAAKYLAYAPSVVSYYPRNITFADKRLKVTINNVWLNGISTGVMFENIDEDDYIYIVAITVNVDGVEYIEKREGKEEIFRISPYKEVNHRLAFFPLNINKYPKIVNNKVSFTRQATVKYSYNGKTYELKSPKMKEEIDVKYGNYAFDPFSL
ncbi:MAG: hypothetical protein LBJ88_04170 [Campylobacteraceae bacterium]|jgi:YHS domain-containing protein|nr:hypothetical protein [Campylobacteraceae bacterium]